MLAGSGGFTFHPLDQFVRAFLLFGFHAAQAVLCKGGLTLTLGILLGFVVSAFGHAYPVLVALGPTMAAMMFGYFVVQGLVVVAETRLGVTRWPRAWRRSWTLVIMVATSPLFVAPCLQVVLAD